MLSSLGRLAKKKDVEAALRKGKRVQGKFLFVKVLKNGTPRARFAVVVSKKVSGKAVVRNRLRRVIREEIRCVVPDLSSGFDAVIVALPSARENEREARREVGTLLCSAMQKI